MHFNLHAAGSRATRMVALTGAAGLLSAAAVMGVGTSAFATQGDVPCGTPAQEAVYDTIEHPAQPAQYETVVIEAEDTLEEWAVMSPGEGWEQGEGRWVETEAAVPGIPEVPELSHTEYKFSKVVVTQAYQPAQYETVVTEREWTKVLQHGYTEYEWKWWGLNHGVKAWSRSTPPRLNWLGEWRKTGNERSVHAVHDTKWFPASRHMGDQGWIPTGNERTEQREVSPEVPELTDTVYAWFATDPGAPWVATGKTKKVVDREYVPGVPGKDAEGYTEYLWTKFVPAVTEERMVKEAVEAWVEKILVTPEVPAGPPCEDDTIPEQPEDLVVVAVTAEVVDCDADVATTTTTTTTTPYVWDEEGEQWVLGEPVTVTETDERELTADECPVVVPIEDEVAGVEEERETPAKPVKNAPTGDEVLGVEASAPSAAPVAVPTAVNAGVPAAAAQDDLTVPALLGGSSLMLLLAGWFQLGRRERGAQEI